MSEDEDRSAVEAATVHRQHAQRQAKLEDLNQRCVDLVEQAFRDPEHAGMKLGQLRRKDAQRVSEILLTRNATQLRWVLRIGQLRGGVLPWQRREREFALGAVRDLAVAFVERDLAAERSERARQVQENGRQGARERLGLATPVTGETKRRKPQQEAISTSEQVVQRQRSAQTERAEPQRWRGRQR